MFKKKLQITITMLLLIFMISCNDNKKITIDKEEYQRLKGDTIGFSYPKRVYIINNPKYSVRYFDIYLGNDGHEYQLHKEYYVADQWIHYPDCIKCKRDTTNFNKN